MKKLLFICIFITGVMNINAQDFWCGTTVDDTFANLATTVANQNVTMESFLSLEPYVIKVHFWDINLDGGANNPDNNLTSVQALNSVAQLNKNYNDFNIFFKYDGISEIESSEYQNLDMDEDNGNFTDGFRPFIRDNNYYLQGAVNLYSVQNIDPIFWIAFRARGNDYFDMIVVENEHIDNPERPYVLTHEVGHFFNLKHTFHCGITDFICENVTRDVTDTDCYNADSAGDGIIDTNATPSSMTIDDNDCTYISSGEVDACGVPYDFEGLEPEVKNFMGYSHPCQQEFTPGQVAHMRWYIDLIDNANWAYTIENNEVSILYEPYQGEYYLAGPSTSHNPPLFQYGFDYVFYDTSQADVYNQPSSYNDTSFWYGDVVQSYDVEYNTPIVHQNHTAFKILQVDGYYPRMCYNNYNKVPSGGTIIKFLDNVPNTNVTITTQDSLQINNTTLIEGLEPGLYNIIENYEDGGTQETMIFKENN